MEASGEIPSEKNSPVFDHYADISEEVEDPRLGLIVPMRPANFDEATQEFVPTPETPFPRIFRLERCIVDVEEFISVIEKSEQRLQMAHENVIQMLDYCYSPSNEEQSEFLFAGFYEQSDTDLEREMEFRGRQEKQFGDLEIFNLIKETINGLVFLQENHLIHGDLRPMYISMTLEPEPVEELQTTELENDAQKFTFKLLDRLGNPLMPQQIHVFNIQEGHDLYLTPHFFESVMQQSQCIRYNPYKGDTFALGVIVLKCGLMVDVGDLYNMETGTFSYDLLEEMKAEFVNIFNDAILSELLSLLLETDDAKRLSPKGIQQKMDQILNRLSDRPEGSKTLEEAPGSAEIGRPRASVSESASEDSDSDSEESVSQEESLREEESARESRKALSDSEVPESQPSMDAGVDLDSGVDVQSGRASLGESLAKSQGQAEDRSAGEAEEGPAEGLASEERPGPQDEGEASGGEVENVGPGEGTWGVQEGEGLGKAEGSRGEPWNDLEKFGEFVDIEKAAGEEEAPRKGGDEQMEAARVEETRGEGEAPETAEQAGGDGAAEWEHAEQFAEIGAEERDPRRGAEAEDGGIEANAPEREEESLGESAKAGLSRGKAEPEQSGEKASQEAGPVQVEAEGEEFLPVEYKEEKPGDSQNAGTPEQDGDGESEGVMEDEAMVMMFNRKMKQVEAAQQIEEPRAAGLPREPFEGEQEQGEAPRRDAAQSAAAEERLEPAEALDSAPKAGEVLLEAAISLGEPTRRSKADPWEQVEEQEESVELKINETGLAMPQRPEAFEAKAFEAVAFKAESFEAEPFVEEVQLSVDNKSEGQGEEPTPESTALENEKAEMGADIADQEFVGSEDEVVEEVLQIADSKSESELEEPEEYPDESDEELPKAFLHIRRAEEAPSEQRVVEEVHIGRGKEAPSEEKVVEEVLQIADSHKDSLLEEPEAGEAEVMELEIGKDFDQTPDKEVQMTFEDAGHEQRGGGEGAGTVEDDFADSQEEEVVEELLQIADSKSESELEEPEEAIERLNQNMRVGEDWPEERGGRALVEGEGEVREIKIGEGEPALEADFGEYAFEAEAEAQARRKEYAELIEGKVENTPIEKKKPRTEDLVRLDTTGNVVVVGTNLDKIKEKYPEYMKAETANEIHMDGIYSLETPTAAGGRCVFPLEESQDFATGYDPRVHGKPEPREEEVVEIALQAEVQPEAETEKVVELEIRNDDYESAPKAEVPTFEGSPARGKDPGADEQPQQVEELALPAEEKDLGEDVEEILLENQGEAEPEPEAAPGNDFEIEGKLQVEEDPHARDPPKSQERNLIAEEMQREPEEDIIYKVKASLKEMILNENEVANSYGLIEKSPKESEPAPEDRAEPEKPEQPEQPEQPVQVEPPVESLGQVELKDPNEPDLAYKPSSQEAKVELELPSKPVSLLQSKQLVNPSSKTELQMQEGLPQKDEVYHEGEPISSGNQDYINNMQRYYQQKYDNEVREDPQSAEMVLNQYEKYSPIMSSMVPPGQPPLAEPPRRVAPVQVTMSDKAEIQRIKERYFEKPLATELITYDQAHCVEPLVHPEPISESRDYKEAPKAAALPQDPAMEPVVPAYQMPIYTTEPRHMVQKESYTMQVQPRNSAQPRRLAPVEQSGMAMFPRESAPLTFSKKDEPELTVISSWKAPEPKRAQHLYKTPERVSYNSKGENRPSQVKNDSGVLGEELPLSAVFKNTARLKQNVQVFRNPESKNKRIVLNNSRVVRGTALRTQDYRSVPAKKAPNYSQSRGPIVKQDFYNRQHSVSAVPTHSKINRAERISVQYDKFYSQAAPVQHSTVRAAREPAVTTPSQVKRVEYEIVSTNFQNDKTGQSWTHDLPTKTNDLRLLTPGASTGERRVRYTTRITPSTESKVIITRKDSRNGQPSSSRVVKYVPTASLSSTAPKNSTQWSETEKNSFQPQRAGVLANSFYPDARTSARPTNGVSGTEKKMQRRDEYHFSSYSANPGSSWNKSAQKPGPKESIVLSRQRNPHLPVRVSQSKQSAVGLTPTKGTALQQLKPKRRIKLVNYISKGVSDKSIRVEPSWSAQKRQSQLRRPFPEANLRQYSTAGREVEVRNSITKVIRARPKLGFNQGY